MSDDGEVIGGLIVPPLIFSWLFVPDSWTNAVWYAAEYGVSIDEVHTNTKPKDCDFTHSPLGDKGCHFKAIPAAYNGARELVGGDGAPKHSRDAKSGKPIISYDGAKNWAWSPTADIPDLKIKSVEVGWAKITD